VCTNNAVLGLGRSCASSVALSLTTPSPSNITGDGYTFLQLKQRSRIRLWHWLYLSLQCKGWKQQDKEKDADAHPQSLEIVPKQPSNAVQVNTTQTATHSIKLARHTPRPIVNCQHACTLQSMDATSSTKEICLCTKKPVLAMARRCAQSVALLSRTETVWRITGCGSVQITYVTDSIEVPQIVWNLQYHSLQCKGSKLTNAENDDISQLEDNVQEPTKPVNAIKVSNWWQTQHCIHRQKKLFLTTCLCFAE